MIQEIIKAAGATCPAIEAVGREIRKTLNALGGIHKRSRAQACGVIVHQRIIIGELIPVGAHLGRVLADEAANGCIVIPLIIQPRRCIVLLAVKAQQAGVGWTTLAHVWRVDRPRW